MGKDSYKGMNIEQMLAILDLPEFKKDRQKIIEVLLIKNGLSAKLFKLIHEEAGCKTESEFIFGERGRRDIEGDYTSSFNYYVRKCSEHQVESAQFFMTADRMPDDWDGITESRRRPI